MTSTLFVFWLEDTCVPDDKISLTWWKSIKIKSKRFPQKSGGGGNPNREINEHFPKMVEDLIVKLMEEANEEAEHKGWCDTELSTNEQTRKEKTEAVETLHAEIDEL